MVAAWFSKLIHRYETKVKGQYMDAASQDSTEETEASTSLESSARDALPQAEFLTLWVQSKCTVKVIYLKMSDSFREFLFKLTLVVLLICKQNWVYKILATFWAQLVSNQDWMHSFLQRALQFAHREVLLHIFGASQLSQNVEEKDP